MSRSIFKCPFCGKIFKRRSLFEEHIQTKEKGTLAAFVMAYAFTDLIGRIACGPCK